MAELIMTMVAFTTVPNWDDHPSGGHEWWCRDPPPVIMSCKAQVFGPLMGPQSQILRQVGDCIKFDYRSQLGWKSNTCSLHASLAVVVHSHSCVVGTLSAIDEPRRSPT